MLSIFLHHIKLSIKKTIPKLKNQIYKIDIYIIYKILKKNFKAKDKKIIY